MANAISKKIDAPVSVGKVDIMLPNRIVVDDLLVFDQNADSMLIANRVAAKIRLREIPNNKIDIISLQMFGVDGRFYKKDDSTPANFQFALDSLFKKKDDDKEGIKVALNSIIVRRSKIGYDRYDKEKTEGVFSPDHLQLNNISAHVFINNSEKNIDGLTVKRLSFDERSGVKMKSLATKISLTDDATQINDLRAEIGQSELNVEKVSIGKSNNQAGDTTPLTVQLSPSKLSFSDAKIFIPTLKNLDGTVNIQGNIESENDGYKAEGIRIEDKARRTLVEANGRYSNSNNAWEANVKNITTNGKTLSDYYTGITGDNKQKKKLESLGNVNATGMFSSKNKNIESRGKIVSEQGSVEYDALYTKANDGLKAKVSTSDMMLGMITGIDKLGKITADLSMESSNISSKSKKINKARCFPNSGV